MTLNITVVTRRSIYQSADYRLVDMQTQKAINFPAQKLSVVNAFRWSALVCFAGVGRTAGGLDVSEWLADRTSSIGTNSPFDALIDELLSADAWLSTVPPPHNRHSFSVGAFIGTRPQFVLISNYEQPSGIVSTTAQAKLSAYPVEPRKPITYVTGQRNAVSRPERRRLAALVASEPEISRVYAALQDVNNAAAARSPDFISSACFTAHVRFTGEGGGVVQGQVGQPLKPTLSFPPEVRDAVERLLDKQFGPGRARLRSLSIGRSDPSDEHHETQLREKPNDPNTHSNYGAFLQDRKADSVGAERAYRKALELDPKHVNALGNLANLLWTRGDTAEADRFYRAALKASIGNENVAWNYARFLVNTSADRAAALLVLNQAVTANPNSGRLYLLRGELLMLHGRAPEALGDIQMARDRGADQAATESVHALALHLSGAPLGECLAAYRVAIVLSPQAADLRLNFAQLLFIANDAEQAGVQLAEAQRLGLAPSAELEAQFYRICHLGTHPRELLAHARSLLAKGARLDWDVARNIDTAAGRDANRATRLRIVRDVMAGNRGITDLERAVEDWD